MAHWMTGPQGGFLEVFLDRDGVHSLEVQSSPPNKSMTMIGQGIAKGSIGLCRGSVSLERWPSHEYVCGSRGT